IPITMTPVIERGWIVMLAVVLVMIPVADAPADQVSSIAAQHQAALKALDAERRKPKATATTIAALTKRARADAFAERMLKLAKESPKSPAAFDALSWTLTKEGGPALAAAQLEAADLMLTHHLAAPKLPQLCSDLSASRSLGAEKMLRGVIDKAPSREARGKA